MERERARERESKTDKIEEARENKGERDNKSTHSE